MQSLQEAFDSLVKNPVHAESSECLKSVALALWYDDFAPSVDGLSGAEAAQAGFLLDKLTRYNCVEKLKKANLRASLLPKLRSQKHGYTAFTAKDKLAQEWGAEFELKNEFRALLKYQRRSFQNQNSLVAA